MRKQTPVQLAEKVSQMKACLKGDQIIDEVDKLCLDRSQPVQEKIHWITRAKNDFRLAQSRIVDDVASVRYQGETYLFPKWKIDNLITYCEVRLEELRNPPAKKYRNRAYGVALILAHKAKLIPSSKWYQKDLRVIASQVFDDIGETHHAVRTALDYENDNKLASMKLDHPDDFLDGEGLFKTYRSRFTT